MDRKITVINEFRRDEWQIRFDELQCECVIYDDGNVVKKVMLPNGEFKNIYLGAMVFITKKIVNIDNGINTFEISMFSDNHIHTKELQADDIFNKFKLNNLQKYGAMVHLANAEHIIGLLERSASIAPTDYKTNKIGWVQTPFSDNPIYMADKAYLAPEGIEINNSSNRFDLNPTGSWENIHKLLLDLSENSELMAVLSMSFASLLMPLAIADGLLSIRGWLTSIVGASSTGKTTSAVLAESLLGAVGINSGSLISSWNGTQQSYTAKLSDVNGLMLTLDEAATISSKSLSGFGFDLASGVERARVNASGELKESKTWTAIVLSTSETSLFPLLPKQEGTLVRTIELSGNFTKSAKQSEDIVALATKNYGWAIPRLMHDIDEMGFDEFIYNMKNSFNTHRKIIKTNLSDSGLTDRLSANLALIMTGTELMKSVLDLPLIDLDEVKSYLVGQVENQLETFKDEADMQTIVEQWIMYNHTQIGQIDKEMQIIPKQPIGYVFYPKRLGNDASYFEVAVLSQELKNMLRSNGTTQINVVLNQFIKSGFLVPGESDRITTRKIVSGTKKPYYVFRISKDKLKFMPALKKIFEPNADNSILPMPNNYLQVATND